MFVALGACATGGGQHPIEDVSLRCNHAYDDGDIVDHLATRPPQGWLVKTREEFDPVALELDRKRVEAFYHERGYFAARVVDVDIDDRKKDGIKVTITVEEGEPTRVASLDLHGIKRDVALDALQANDVELRAGKRFDHPSYLLAKDTIEHALVKQGYAHAEVTGVVEVNREAHQAIVRLDVDPGPLVHFGKVKVEGLKTVPESAILNRVAWHEGEVFDPQLLDQTEGRIYLLGLFSAAHADYSHEGRPPVVDITVQVAEAPKHEVRFGFGVGVDRSRFEARTRGGYTLHDAFDALSTIRLDVTPGYSWLRSTPYTSAPSIEATAQLERDDFVLPNVKAIAVAAFEREPHQGYILTGPRLNVGAAYPFGNDDFKLHVGWEIRYADFSDYDPMVFASDAVQSWLGFYEQQIIYDHRDRPLDAHSGFYAQLEALEGGVAAGGQVDFIRVAPEVRAYLPLGTHRLVLAGRARYGRIVTFNPGNDAPLPIRFYGGGANDHRGFGFQRLAPQRRDSDGNLIAVGGTEELLGSVELRVELFKWKKQWFSLAAFFDTGDVTNAGALELDALHHAVGLGLRYDTIIGPVRADVGFRLNRVDGPMDPDPGDRFAFHISLGEAF